MSTSSRPPSRAVMPTAVTVSREATGTTTGRLGCLRAPEGSVMVSDGNRSTLSHSPQCDHRAGGIAENPAAAGVVAHTLSRSGGTTERHSAAGGGHVADVHPDHAQLQADRIYLGWQYILPHPDPGPPPKRPSPAEEPPEPEPDAEEQAALLR